MEIPLLLNELVEELDVFIAQRQFDESLDHIEECNFFLLPFFF